VEFGENFGTCRMGPHPIFPVRRIVIKTRRKKKREKKEVTVMIVIFGAAGSVPLFAFVCGVASARKERRGKEGQRAIEGQSILLGPRPIGQAVVSFNIPFPAQVSCLLVRRKRQLHRAVHLVNAVGF